MAKKTDDAASLPKLPQPVWVATEEIRLNPDNPHKFSKSDMDNLIRSIQDFPEMLRLRPLVLDNEQSKTVYGGNKRLIACVQLEHKHVPVLYADQLTAEQLQAFVVLDNVSFGQWDADKLLEGWSEQALAGWGISLPTDEPQDNVPTETLEVRPFERVHVLLSMPPQTFLDNQAIFEQLKNTEGIEYEQGAN